MREGEAAVDQPGGGGRCEKGDHAAEVKAHAEGECGLQHAGINQKAGDARHAEPDQLGEAGHG